MQSNPQTSKVRDLSFDGNGVVDSEDGKVFFIPGAIPGDEIRWIPTKVKKNYGFGELIEIIVSSDYRVESPCSYQGFSNDHCGGCPQIIMDYSFQLKMKMKRINQYLDRNQISVESGIKEIIPSEKTLGYRNRAQLKTNGEKLGFIAKGTNHIIDIDDCVILQKPLRDQLSGMREKLPNEKWRPGGRHKWTLVEFDSYHSEPLIDGKFPFRQANDDQNKIMKSWVTEKVKRLSGSWIELFCGSGNFTEIISSNQDHSILACEFSKKAVEELDSKNFKKVKTHFGNIDQPKTWNQLQKKIVSPLNLFLDPPREGFQGLHEFLNIFPSISSILYVSCSLETFTSDVKPLVKSGWRICEIQPVDQFPHTPHIELLVHLKKA